MRANPVSCSSKATLAYLFPRAWAIGETAKRSLDASPVCSVQRPCLSETSAQTREADTSKTDVQCSLNIQRAMSCFPTLADINFAKWRFSEHSADDYPCLRLPFNALCVYGDAFLPYQAFVNTAPSPPPSGMQMGPRRADSGTPTPRKRLGPLSPFRGTLSMTPPSGCEMLA